MKLTKKQEAEILSVYKSYWDGYLAGDLKSMVALLDASYTQVGSAEGEVFYTRQKAIKFLKETITQIAGKGKIKKQRIKIEVLKDGVLVNDLFDLYVLAYGEWIFYSNFRASTLMKEIRGKWKFIHQHSSVPDIRTAEGENVATEKITAENLQLKDAIKRRTVELEQKNRELEIEAALEKVRTRSLAMQKSEELKEVIQVVFDQFIQLKIDVEHTGFIIDYKTRDDMHIWLADQHKIPAEVSFPYFDSPHWNSFLEAKKKGRNFFTNQLNFKTKNKFYQSLFKLIPGVSEEIIKYYLSCPGLAISTVLLDNVGLYIENFSGTPYSDEENNTLIRFAKVFEQTYTRFLDLQKAEAQAREAEIQLALERVRARTMAMHKSEELLDVITVVSEQLLQLNFRFDHVSFANSDFDQEYKFWTAARLMPKPMRLILPHIDIPMFNHLREAQQQGLTFFTDILTKQENVQWHKHMLKNSSNNIFSKEENEYIMNRGMARSIVIHPNIILILANYAAVPYSEEENKIIARFGQVFEQSYIRFLDLQKAEAQAREAEIELALERVRARTMAMQRSDELAEASFLLDSQIRALGIQTRGCAFNIYGKQESTEWFSSEAGTLPVYKTPRENVFLKYYKAGQKGESLIIEEFAGKACAVHYDYLCTIPIMGEALRKIKEGGGSFPTRQIDHVAYFKYGYLLFITLEPVPEVYDIFKRFAKVFEQTYTRFLDLQKAEAQALRAEHDLLEIKNARRKAEEALTELQATQKQLIQSEKMASLGELTAGIAHEIQNPLNFVNNFSEVSNELIDEMKTEQAAGNWSLAAEIADDVKSNLEKIVHHGKLAEGIVKGMLQHSRSSSGAKEPTDINALCDEYLRLSYHGLRAKDKSFNAKFEVDFDSSLPKINVAPQDIGRVILNLINNAFYVVNQQRATSSEQRDPLVIVTTKNLGDKIEIKVTDNGNGIPDSIKEKIFQPFFTTKPTGQGTGLGLSLSYDIVKAHGGELKVESKEGEGSEFIINIPLV